MKSSLLLLIVSVVFLTFALGCQPSARDAQPSRDDSGGTSESAKEATRTRTPEQIVAILNSMIEQSQAISDGVRENKTDNLRPKLEEIKTAINELGLGTIAGTPDGASLPQSAVFLEKAIVKMDKSAILIQSVSITTHAAAILQVKSPNIKNASTLMFGLCFQVSNPEFTMTPEIAENKASQIQILWLDLKESPNVKKIKDFDKLELALNELKGAKTVQQFQVLTTQILLFEPVVRVAVEK